MYKNFPDTCCLAAVIKFIVSNKVEITTLNYMYFQLTPIYNKKHVLDYNKNHKRISQILEENLGAWILVPYLHCMLRAASLTREYPEVLLVAMHEKVPESSSRVTRRI